jgi:hypothetical protein
VLLYKIADCVRTDFRPYAIGDPRGRVFVRAGFRNTCALRAPTVFFVRIKNIRTKNTVMDKSKIGVGCFCQNRNSATGTIQVVTYNPKSVSAILKQPRIH